MFRRPVLLVAEVSLALLMAVMGLAIGMTGHKDTQFSQPTIAALCPPQSSASCLIDNSSNEDNRYVDIIDFMMCDDHGICFFDISSTSEFQGLIQVDLYKLPSEKKRLLFQAALSHNRTVAHITGHYDHMSHLLMAESLIWYAVVPENPTGVSWTPETGRVAKRR